jgi:amidase
MNRPTRRWTALVGLLSLLLAVAGASAPIGFARGDTATRVAGIDVDATTIPQLEALMDAHRLSSVQLVQFYLHRIAKLNPTLHAVITVSPTALADARAADRARSGAHGPLLGIPVIVKDNIDTTGMPTTAGSFALAGSRPPDAFIVSRLRAAGALIIGKANLSEWANFRSIPSSSGWSGIGGQTNMAYVLDRNPCGSSSGSGVAASADLATVTVGTETDGSIVCPSGANGDAGIKPTLGLLSRSGIVPITADQDTAGPIARNMTDAAVLLGATSGVDPADVPIAPAYGPEFTALLCEFKSDVASYLAAHTAAGYPKTLQDLIDFNNAHRQLEGPWGSEIFDLAQATGGRADPNCVAARAAATSLAQAAINDTLAAQHLDAIIAPTNGPAWVTDPIKGDLGGDFSKFIGSSSPSAIAGYASVTVPAGFVGPLPVGVSFIGGRWDEPKLIALAYALEQATHVRVPPTFLPTTAFP